MTSRELMNRAKECNDIEHFFNQLRKNTGSLILYGDSVDSALPEQTRKNIQGKLITIVAEEHDKIAKEIGCDTILSKKKGPKRVS